jgi:hypothetical protein
MQMSEPFKSAAWGHECSKEETVNHPAHYGGANNPYEAIKVIEAWSLGFNLGNTVKYISRAGKKGAPVEDLKKARWYLDREISRVENGGHCD